MPVFVVDGVLHPHAVISTRDDASPLRERSHACLPAAKQDIFARMRFQNLWSGWYCSAWCHGSVVQVWAGGSAW